MPATRAQRASVLFSATMVPRGLASSYGRPFQCSLARSCHPRVPQIFLGTTHSDRIRAVFFNIKKVNFPRTLRLFNGENSSWIFSASTFWSGSQQTSRVFGVFPHSFCVNCATRFSICTFCDVRKRGCQKMSVCTIRVYSDCSRVPPRYALRLLWLSMPGRGHSRNTQNAPPRL